MLFSKELHVPRVVSCLALPPAPLFHRIIPCLQVSLVKVEIPEIDKVERDSGLFGSTSTPILSQVISIYN